MQYSRRHCLHRITKFAQWLYIIVINALGSQFLFTDLLCKEDRRQLGVASNMSAKINNEDNLLSCPRCLCIVSRTTPLQGW